MSRVRVKICGLTNSKDLQIAVKAGADAAGFIVGSPRSPRNLSVSQARRLMKEVPPFVARVAVTVFSSDHSLENIITGVKPDFLQVHGGDDSNLIESRRNLGVPIIRAIDLNQPNSSIEFQSASKFDAIILDSSSGDGYGGSGRVVDWNAARLFRENSNSTPIILSGGLYAENVQTAIRTVHPYAVDVCSGVEMEPGKKDPVKVRKFIAEAKDAN